VPLNLLIAGRPRPTVEFSNGDPHQALIHNISRTFIKKEALRSGINFLYRGQGQAAVAFAGELRQGIDNRWREHRNRRFTAS
jgi:hypothetical protein